MGSVGGWTGDVLYPAGETKSRIALRLLRGPAYVTERGTEREADVELKKKLKLR